MARGRGKSLKPNRIGVGTICEGLAKLFLVVVARCAFASSLSVVVRRIPKLSPPCESFPVVAPPSSHFRLSVASSVVLLCVVVVTCRNPMLLLAAMADRRKTGGVL